MASQSPRTTGLTSPSEALAAAVAAIRCRWSVRPSVGLILGSGLGELADEVQSPCTLPFDEIPHHPRATVEGHQGQLVLGLLEEAPVAIWRGRAHFYEGRSMAEIGFPIRLMCQLGARATILTNAAGGLNESFSSGDLMLFTDHINLPGLAGHNPLRGPPEPSFGERFVDLSQAYDPNLLQLAEEVAQERGFTLQKGVYAMVAGPTYETPAEARLLRQLGADAVGMSTVPEAIVARQVGLRVLAISAITNVLLGATGTGASHAEVLATAAEVGPRLGNLIRGILSRMRETLAE